MKQEKTFRQELEESRRRSIRRRCAKMRNEYPELSDEQLITEATTWFEDREAKRLAKVKHWRRINEVSKHG